MSVVKTAVKPEEFLCALANETQKLIGTKSADIEQCKLHMLMYVTQFICLMLLRTLSERPDKVESLSNDEVYDYVHKNFGNMKSHTQEAVSTAFAAAMTQFTGHQMEYYCQIRTVGPALNKEPI